MGKRKEEESSSEISLEAQTEFTCNAGDLGLIPELGQSLGEVNGNPLQFSCPGIPMDRGAWRATVQGVAKSWIQLSD